MRLTFLVLSFYGLCFISGFVLQGGITNSSVKLELSFQDLLRLVEGGGHSHGQASLNASIHSELADLKIVLKHLISDVNKAKSSRENLQYTYTDLKVEFASMSEALENLTRKYKDVFEENSFLTEANKNLTHEFHASRNRTSVLINKMMKNVTDAKGALVIMGEALENLSRKYDKVLEENSCLADVKSNLTHELHTSRNRTNLLINEMLKNVTDVKGALSQLIQKQGLDVAFTVLDPKHESGNRGNPLVFKTIRYNSGNSYNVSTGIFVCRYPGLYLLAATITRKPGIDQSYCCIKLNGDCLVYTVSYGSDSNGYPSGTTTLVKHLNVSDVAFLSDCHGVDHMNFDSQFSGALLQPDLN